MSLPPENTHYRRSPSTSSLLSLLMGAQTAPQVELVQTLLHHLFQHLTFLVATAFVLSQLLFCFSEQFRPPKSLEALIRSLALPSYATHNSPTASYPLDSPTSTSLLLPDSRGHTGTIPQLYHRSPQTIVIITTLQTYGILHLLPKLDLTMLLGTLCLSCNHSHTRQFPFFNQVLN